MSTSERGGVQPNSLVRQDGNAVQWRRPWAAPDMTLLPLPGQHTSLDLPISGRSFSCMLASVSLSPVRIPNSTLTSVQASKPTSKC